MLESIAEKLLEVAAEKAVGVLADSVKRRNDELLASGKRRSQVQAALVSLQTVVKPALARHVAQVDRWSREVRFADLSGSKLVQKIYVPLDAYLIPLSLHEDERERKATKPLLAALKTSDEHTAILGSAGAGKTTALQKICVDYFRAGKVFGKYNFPILIRLREIASQGSAAPIVSAIQQTLSLQITFSKGVLKADPDFVEQTRRSVITSYLDELNVAILIDGFDELPAGRARDSALSDIEFLCSNLSVSRVLVTSRASEFRYRSLALRAYELASLNAKQIEQFAENWLESKAEAREFNEKVSNSPYLDTLVRPLTLAHLCAIYERIHDIPEKPKSVYRRVVQLLLEDWDAQRRVARSSAYAGFDRDRKMEFLAHLAYFLSAELDQLVFNSESLHFAYQNIHGDHGLPADQAVQVVREVESHSGLIVESARGKFEFAHKSLQEFLAADYIVRLPRLELIEEKFQRLPNELAIAVSLSSSPASFLAEIFLRSTANTSTVDSWLSDFLTRLATERIELHKGASTFSAIAALSIAQRMPATRALVDHLRPAFPPNSTSLLQQLYSVQSRDGIHTWYELINQSAKYVLPKTLRVENTMLKWMASSER